MPTPALAIQTTMLHDAPAASKKPESASSDGSFNQVLSREMSSRQPERNDGNSPSASSASRPESSQPADPAAPGKASKNDKRSQKAEADKSAKDDTANDTNAVQDGTAIPSDMMALIAGATLMQQQPAATDETSAAVAADAALSLSDTAVKGIALTDIDAKAEIPADGKPAADVPALSLQGDDARASDALPEKPLKEFADNLRAAAHDKDAGDDDLRATGGNPVTELLKPADTPSEASANAATLATDATLQRLNALHATHAASPHADRLTPRVGTPAWDNALSQKVVWMVAGEHQSASLTLNPPDLGPLQVVLNVSNSMASATFITAQPEVKQAIENALPKLKEMMDEAGVQLGQATVNTGMPNQRDAPGDDRYASRGNPSGSASAQPAAAEVSVSRTTVTSAGRGLVDTFA